MPKSREKFLLARFGGMGDNLFLTPVAKVLTDRGYDVDVITRKDSAPLLHNNPYFKNVIVSERFGQQQAHANGHPVNLIQVGSSWVPDKYLFREYMPATPRTWRPFNVADYFAILESCSIHPEISKTQMSTYSNTYDNHLAWAGIDPHSVSANDKRPLYFVTEEERAWATKLLGSLSSKPVMLQTFSSSPARSYSPSRLLDVLGEKGDHVVAFDPERGRMVLDGIDVEWPEGIPTIRATGALIEQCKFVVSADTCVTHQAEALSIPHLTFYTIIPAWTRNQYYQYEIDADSTAQLDGQACKCHQITRDCPRKSVEAMRKLTKEETELLALLPGDHDARRVMKLPAPGQPEGSNGDLMTHFNVSSPKAVNEKIDAALRRYNTLLQETAYCSASIDLAQELVDNYDKLSNWGDSDV